MMTRDGPLVAEQTFIIVQGALVTRPDLPLARPDTKRVVAAGRQFSPEPKNREIAMI